MNKQLAIGIKTFMRPALLLRNVEIIRQNLPNVKIYIADDNRQEFRDEVFYTKLEEEGHCVIRLPYDVGISAGRNVIADEVKESYLLMCDDDFEITPDNNVFKIVEIMKKRPDIGIITGTLYRSGHPTGYEYDLYIVDRTIHKLPLTSQWEKVNGFKIRRAELGLNFFVARTEMFKDVRWDKGFLISTEHLDFFLQVKQTKWKVYFCPELKSIHAPCVEDKEYNRFRHRKFHWKYFADKWNVDWVQEGDIRMNYRTESDKWTSQPECINHIVFRDDDVCVDTPVDKLKELTELFESYGIDETYSVIPYGRMVKDGEYSSDNNTLESLVGKEPIENNKELVRFLRKKIKVGHNICLHGFRHINLEDIHLHDILDAKAYLEKLLKCRIFYFAPPFNTISDYLRKELETRDMTVIAGEGDALEKKIENGRLDNYFCWYHWWKFQSPELYQKLKDWLKINYKKLEEYSK